MRIALRRNKVVSKLARRARPKWGSVGLCAAVALLTGAISVEPANARQLKNFVLDLFNGQGIAVNDRFEGPESFSLQTAAQSTISTINSSIAINLGVSSFSTAVVSSGFDLTKGLPVTQTRSLGPIFAERAETLGKGLFDLGMSFSHARFTELNGQPLDNLNFVLVAPPPQDDRVMFNINIGLTRNVYAFKGTYGITSRWDVGLVVPIVDVSASATATATLVGGHDYPIDSFFASGSNTESSHTSGNRTGIGDIALRTKYNFIQNNETLPDVSVLGQVTFPSGNVEDLLGAGSTDVLGELILSKQIGLIAPHFNLGYEQAIAGLNQDNLRYVAGADIHITNKLTGSMDMIGRKNFGGVNTADFAVGARWKPFSVGILGAAFIVPINKGEGLRPDYIWSVTANFTF